MANLSQNDRNIIAEHPLSKCLDYLQESLQEAEQNHGPGPILYNSTFTDKNQRRQEAISSFLLALMGHKAFNLCLEIGDDNIATELRKLFGLVRGGRYNYKHYCTLSRLIVKQAPDVDIWTAVFGLITIVS